MIDIECTKTKPVLRNKTENALEAVFTAAQTSFYSFFLFSMKTYKDICKIK